MSWALNSDGDPIHFVALRNLVVMSVAIMPSLKIAGGVDPPWFKFRPRSIERPKRSRVETSVHSQLSSHRLCASHMVDVYPRLRVDPRLVASGKIPSPATRSEIHGSKASFWSPSQYGRKR